MCPKRRATACNKWNYYRRITKQNRWIAKLTFQVTFTFSVWITSWNVLLLFRAKLQQEIHYCRPEVQNWFTAMGIFIFYRRYREINGDASHDVGVTSSRERWQSSNCWYVSLLFLLNKIYFQRPSIVFFIPDRRLYSYWLIFINSKLLERMDK